MLRIDKKNHNIPLETTSSGHLVIDIMNPSKKNREDVAREIFLLNSEDESLHKKLKKVHRSFGHPSSSKLIETLKDSGVTDPIILKKTENISQDCAICRKHMRRESRPKNVFRGLYLLME